MNQRRLQRLVPESAPLTPAYIASPLTISELAALKHENDVLKKRIEFLNRSHVRVLDQLAKHSRNLEQTVAAMQEAFATLGKQLVSNPLERS